MEAMGLSHAPVLGGSFPEPSNEANPHHEEDLLSYTRLPVDRAHMGANNILPSEYGHLSDSDHSLTPPFHNSVFQPTNGNTGECRHMA